MAGFCVVVSCLVCRGKGVGAGDIDILKALVLECLPKRRQTLLEGGSNSAYTNVVLHGLSLSTMTICVSIIST